MIRTRPRIILDTNTLVSAVLNESSIPAQAVEKAIRTGAILFSVETSDEFADVLLREKFDRYRGLEARRSYLEYIVGVSDVISVLTRVEVCRHSKDDKFLELAIDGRADLLITGDKDLLVLHPFQGVEILTAADYLAR